MPAINLYLTSFADDPIETVAQQIIAQQEDSLPLLSNTIIFTPQTNIAAELRFKLLNAASQKNYSALLGPLITPLQQWLQQYQPGELNVVNATSQELILVEALQQHQGIFESSDPDSNNPQSNNPWIYAHSLLELFQELTANKIELPQDEDDFINQIRLAYGLDDNHTNIEALSREAHFVFTLWHAWHNQLDAYKVVDSTTAQLLSMQLALEELTIKENINQQDRKINFYLLGYDSLTTTESQWLEQLSQHHNVHYFLQGQFSGANNELPSYHPDKHISDCIKQFENINFINTAQNNSIKNTSGQDISNKADFINTVYDIQAAPLIERTKQYTNNQTSPLNNVHVFSANDDEQEARAIDIQLRSWLLEGKTKLAIVTENRRLARRVRALLERSGVFLQDAAGWALSTTRAAATLERWLECIEQDFHYLSLLDLLKSAFVFPELNREALQYAVYRLEQDIIRHENISQHLDAYRAGIVKREHLLSDWIKDTHSILKDVLDQLEQAAESLIHISQKESFTPQEFISTLLDSLKLLGLDRSLKDDAAGIKIINLLNILQVESDLVNLTLNWSEARAWLAMQLERSRFMPAASTTQVQLIGLSQSQFQKFDGLIIAAVEDQFLPGSPTPSAFFNDAVKYELELKTSLQDKNERFHHFIRLLNSSDNILLSYRNQGDNGEAIKPSAWLALLEQFHSLAFNNNLENETLQQLVNAPENTFTHTARHVATESQQPTPAIPENLIPKKISASQYQELINCPYLFYAARCLKLDATDEMREALSKADYGERIHKCLQAFHGTVDGLPGPFKSKVNENNRDAAEKLLNNIIKSVFSSDLSENHEHQAWYSQAKKITPHYIDWQMTHSLDSSLYKVEEKITKELDINNTSKPLTLSGRLDRIDKDENGLVVIDYKTGAYSKNKEVESGEQVQLPFYHTLLQDEDNQVTQVEYLEVKSDVVKTRAKLSGDKLETIAEESAERLKEIFSQLHTQTGLPAWGDEKTCSRCGMQGICRKQMWQDS